MVLSVLWKNCLLGPSPVLGRLDPLKVKHNSSFISKKKSPYKLSEFISVTTDFLAVLTGPVGGGSALGLCVPNTFSRLGLLILVGQKKNKNK